MTDRTDNFNRTDATTLGTPSDGGSAWVVQTGASTDFQIKTNQVGLDAGVSVMSNELVYLEASIAAATVQVTFATLPSTPNTEQGMCARLIDGSNYWRLKYRNGSTVDFQKVVSGSFTTIGTHSGIAAGDVFAMKPDSGDNWTVTQNGTTIFTTTDSANNTGTKHGLNVNMGSGPDGMRWEDFSITALAAAAAGAVIGAARIATKRVGPAVQRFLFRQPVQIFGGATMEPQLGDLDYSVMPPVLLANPMVGPPVLRRRFLKQPSLLWTAASGPQLFQQALTATLGFVGALVKSVSTARSATLSFVGAEVTRTARALAGTLSFIGAATPRAAKALTGTLSFVGNQSRQVAKTLAGTLSFVGSQVRAVTHGMAAALSFVGSALKRTATARTATLAFVGSLVTGNAFIRAFTATLSFSGAFAKLPNKALAGTLSFSGAQSRSIGKALAAALSFVGALTRRVSTAKTATLSFAGNLLTGQAYVRALTATLSFAGSLSTSRVTLKALTATLSFAGAVSRRTGKALTGGLTASGTVARRVSKGIASTLSFAGALVKRTARGLTAALSFVGAMVGFKLGSPTIARITLADSRVYRVAVSDAAAPSSSGDRAVTGITASDQ